VLKIYRLMIKGKAYPVGTIREWKGRKYRKASDKKWVEVVDGVHEGARPWPERAKVLDWWAKLTADRRKEIIEKVKAEVGHDLKGDTDIVKYVLKHKLMEGSKAPEVKKPDAPKAKRANTHRVFVVHVDGSPVTEYDNLTLEEAQERFRLSKEDANAEIVTWDRVQLDDDEKIMGRPSVAMWTRPKPEKPKVVPKKAEEKKVPGLDAEAAMSATWDYESAPSMEYALKAVLESLQQKLDALPDAVREKVQPPDAADFYTGWKQLKDFEDGLLDSKSIGAAGTLYQDLMALESVQSGLDVPSRNAISNLRYATAAAAQLRQSYNAMQREPIGKLGITGSMVMTDGRVGLQFSDVNPTRRSILVLPYIPIPYDKIEGVLNKFADESSKKRIMKYVKGTAGYKDHLMATDPKIAKLVTAFRDEIGLEITTDAIIPGREAKLSAPSLRALFKVFSTISSVVNFKDYVPSDGKKMILRIAKASKKAAGFYVEKDHSLNISPSYPGAIVHEAGHYFFYRGGKVLVDEFKEWVKASGLEQKIKETFNPSHAAFKTYIDQSSAVALSEIGGYLTAHPDLAGRKGLDVLKFVEIVEPSLRAMLHNANQADDRYGTVTPDEFLSTLRNALNDPDKHGPAIVSETKGVYSVDDLKSIVDRVRFAPAKVVDRAFEMYSQHLSEVTVHSFRKQTHSDYYSKRSRYWGDVNEVFARTFDQFIRYKAKQPEYTTTDERMDAVGDAADNPFGWGFPEVDPTYAMFEDGKFEGLLKKHFGPKLLKAIRRLAYVVGLRHRLF